MSNERTDDADASSRASSDGSRSEPAKGEGTASTSRGPKVVFPAAAELGSRLRARREELGLSLEKVAQMTEMNWSYVGGLERGTRNPTLRTMLRLADALEIDPAELVRGLSAPESE